MRSTLARFLAALGTLLACASAALAQATFTWNSGAAPATSVANGQSMAIGTGADHDFNTTSLINQGTVEWEGGRLRSGNAGGITNQGTWLDLGTSLLAGNAVGASSFKNDFGGTFSFTNSGTYRKTGTGTTTFFDVSFANTGSLEIEAGILDLLGGGSSSGPISVSTGAKLRFGNSYALDSGTSITGAGTVEAVANTLTLNGAIDLGSNFNLAGATLAGTHSLTGSLRWLSGNLSSNGTTTITSDGHLVLSSATDHDLNGRTLINKGLVDWEAGRIRSGNGGAITNEATWNDNGTSALGGTSVGANAFKNDFGGAFSFTNVPDATYNKTGSGTTTFQDVPFNNSGLVSVQAGTLILGGGGTSSGEFGIHTGATLRLTGNYAFSTGAFTTGAGIFEATGGTTTVSGDVDFAGFALKGATLAGTHTLSGQFTWQSGPLASGGSTTINSGADFTITGTGDHDFNGRALTNNGTVNWDSGRLRSGSSGSITNQATWNDSGTSTLGGTSVGATAFKNDFGGAFSFSNVPDATYNKTGSGTTTFVDVPFLNDGYASIQAGTLVLHGGGTNTGEFSVSSGAALRFTNSYTLSAGSSLSGPGTIEATGGTLTVNDSVSVDGLRLFGATLAGTHTFLGDVTWETGLLASGGTTNLESGYTLTIAGTNDHDFNGRTLVNNGQVEWNGGRLRSGNGGAITNNGNWNDNSGSYLGGATIGAAAFKNDFSGSFAFNNGASGYYTKNGGGVTTFVDVPLNNSGTVDVQDGTLVLGGGGTNHATGYFNVSYESSLEFANSYSFASGTGIYGYGEARATGGTFTLNGSVNLDNFYLAGATLAGTHQLYGDIVWTSGSLSSTGTTENTNGSTFTVANSSDHDFNGRTFVNHGTVIWQSGRLRSGNSGSIANAGTWEDAGTAVLAGTNVGALAFKNDFGGSFSFTNQSTGSYYKSGVGLTTFVDVPFTNDGELRLAAGTLQFSGGLTLAATGTLRYDLSGLVAGSGFGQLNATQPLALSGYLDLYLLGGYESTLSPSDQFILLTAPSLSGTFGNIASGDRLHTVDGLGSFLVHYGATSSFGVNQLVLTGFTPVPEPSTWALLGAGAIWIGLLARRRRR